MRLVPLIDLSGWTNGDPATRARIAADLDDGCRRVGFLEITGHGVDPAVAQAMNDAADAFFALPLEEKLRRRPPRPEVNRGYAAAGSEGLAYSIGAENPPDLFEAFNIGEEHVPDDPWHAAERHRIFAPNVWPETPATFRPALLAWFDEAKRVAQLLTEVFAVALGLPEGFFRDKTDRSTNTLRVVHYERRGPAAPVLDGQMRMGAHTDFGICTVLYADPVPGLQIVGPDGLWHDVVPAAGNLVVNIGDLTALWTNDRWRSTLHRVVPPPADLDGPFVRRSAAFFHDGNYDALVECLPTCTSADDPPRYGPVVAGEHLLAKVMAPRSFRVADATSTVGTRPVG